MPSNDLTAAEVAALIDPANHPTPLSAQELEDLTAHLSDQEVQEVVQQLGLGALAQQLPPIVNKLLRAAHLLTVASPPEYDDDVDSIIRHLDVVSISSDEEETPVPAAPSLGPSSSTQPTSSAPPATPARTRPTSSLPSGYIVRSPQKVGPVLTWFEAGSLTLGMRAASVRRGAKKHPGSHKPRSGAYAVFFGGEVGVFEHWSDVQPRITGHGLAIYSGFKNVTAAEAALQYARSQGWTSDSSPPTSDTRTHSTYTDNPLNSDPNSRWYVVCRGVRPGVYHSYLECSLNTSGVPGNLCNAFDTQAEAEQAFTQAEEQRLVRAIPRSAPAHLI
ncbi:hypothetical protein B0H15DRAFT_807851 [Mycena belliarum]|uniref:Ribonuclease H1 N-terminal domain-containing protein n=1 Tax=Mycena belliarum TaxID=1033014 RepID=A0AAD6TK16_9AGAR|nr:hypothetical protein B0H15DRAFT_807851 [Mycena belliae]